MIKHHFNSGGNQNQNANNEKSYHTCWNSDSDLLWLALAILFMATNCKKICEVCHCLAMLNLDLGLKIRTKMKKKKKLIIGHGYKPVIQNISVLVFHWLLIVHHLGWNKWEKKCLVPFVQYIMSKNLFK